MVAVAALTCREGPWDKGVILCLCLLPHWHLLEPLFCRPQLSVVGVVFLQQSPLASGICLSGDTAASSNPMFAVLPEGTVLGWGVLGVLLVTLTQDIPSVSPC